MKRYILIYLFVVMIMLFAGCKSSNVINGQTDKPVESKSNNVTDYKVNIKEYVAYNEENNSFKVKYAQISDLGNDSLENQINQTLKSSITEWINKDCDWVERFQITIKCKTSKYLSLCYTIEWGNPRGEDLVGTFTRIGLTVDIQTGDRVYLNDLIKDTANLKQTLVNYNYGTEFSPPIDYEEADKIIHYASISEKKYFEEIYKTDPHVYIFMKSYLGLKSSFYLADKQLVITRDENEFNDVYIDFNQ